MKHQEQSLARADSPTEHWKPRWSVRCGSINFKNIPNYETACLLHSLCPAIRRHADSRVNNSFQRPSAEPRLVQYACLSQPGTHRRVPTARH